MTSSRQSALAPSASARREREAWLAAAACALAGAAMFQFFGNATRGYIASSSLFYWWGFQWVNPGSETEHGWLILALSGWLWWKRLSIADCGLRSADCERRKAEVGRRKGEGGEGKSETGDRKPEAGNGRAQTGDGDSDVGIVGADAEDRKFGSDTAPASPVSGFRNPVSPNPHSALRNPQSLTAPFLALTAGLALHALGFAAQQTRISIVAFLVFTWGVVRLGGGRRWGDAAMFPLAFMLFALPISVLDEIGLPLRLWVTTAGERIAHLAGIEVVRSGTQLVAPDGRFNYDVAAPCSGVRSLMALTALSVLVGYLNFRTWWRRVLVFGLCLPLVYLGNVARIVAIIFAAQAGGPEWGDRAHQVMGYGVFVIVLGGVLLGVALINRWWPETSSASRTAAAAAPAGRRRANDWGGAWLTTASVAVGIVLLTTAEMVFLHRLATMPPRGEVGVVLAADGLNPVELPAFLGTEWIGQRADVSAVEREILPADTGFSRKNYAFIGNRTHDVFLSVVLSGRDRTSIHRPELCLVGQGWTIAGATRHTFQYPGNAGDGRGFEATVLRVRREIVSPRGRRVVPQLVAYWFVGGDGVVPSHGQRFLRDAWNRIARARADRWAYVLMQTDATEGEAAALARMQTVLEGTLPVFQKRVKEASEMAANATDAPREKG